MGETIDVISGVKLEARAEVGILSRSILFRGSDNMQWHDEIEPCPEGFDPGMYNMGIFKLKVILVL